MKRILPLILICASLFVAGCSYDDSDLRGSIDNIDGRLKTLEEKVSAMNTEISSMKTIVDALNGGKVITGVEEITGGYKITFSDNRTINVNHGGNGANGTSPVIGVDQHEGVFYWTVTVGDTKEWLQDGDGNKVKVTGDNGAAPVLGVNGDGCWTVDGVVLLDNAGNPVKASATDGDSFFKGVTVRDTEIEFELSDGATITVPRSGELAFTITAQADEQFLFGAVREFAVTEKGVEQYAISKPDGWRVSYAAGKLTVQAPDKSNAWAERDGKVSIVVTGENATLIAEMGVGAFDMLMDFEAADEGFFAGPTSYGANLYDGAEDQVFGYYDNGTDLFMGINEFYGSYDFWNGGTAVSRWNDTATEGYTNQCSVYYKDPVTGYGGRDGSQTFGVVYSGYMGMLPEIFFLDDDTEMVFDHFYVTNATYAALSMLNGDSYAKKFTYEDQDWFKLTVKGFDKNGTSTGSVDFYLADFRTPASPGVVTGWTKVDLAPLGRVHKIAFEMMSSDVGDYGLNTPTYFCFDDMALRAE